MLQLFGGRNTASINDDSDSDDNIQKPLPQLPGRHVPRAWSFQRYIHPYQWTTILLRSLSLQAFNFPRQHRSAEPRKVAVDKSRFKALVRNAVHIIPVGVCIYLIQLNWRTQYFLSDSKWYSALPFASKAHEVLMQLSLAAVLASWIRRELLQDHGLPFGGLVALFQSTNPAYLLSPEFWGSLSTTTAAGNRNHWRSARFAIFIIMTISLASGVGPSSTIAMLPRLGKFILEDDNLKFSASEAQMFPSRLDTQPVGNNCTAIFMSQNVKRDEAEAICSPDDFQATVDVSNVVGGNVYMDGEYVTVLGGLEMRRQMRFWLQTPANYDPYYDSGYYFDNIPVDKNATSADSVGWKRRPGSSLVATTQYYHLTKSLEENSEFVFSGTENATWDIPRSYSMESAKIPYVTTQCYLSYFPVEYDRSLKVRIPNFDDGDFEYDLTMTEFQNRSIGTNISHVVWDEAPKDQAGISALAFINTPLTGSACAIKASWGTGSMNSSRADALTSKIIEQRTLQSSRIGGEWRNYTKWPSDAISISPQWLQQILPTRTILANKTDYDTSEAIRLTCNGDGDLYSLPELFLSGVVAGGMARLYNTAGFDSFNSTGTRPADEGYHTNLLVYYYGRGWIITQPTEKLAMAILGIYCFVVLLHVLYTLGTGVSSNNWDSVAELTALALNSQPPEALQNTSSGISTRKTFSQPIGIRARREKGLELVFVGDQQLDDRDLETVEFNRKY